MNNLLKNVKKEHTRILMNLKITGSLEDDFSDEVLKHNPVKISQIASTIFPLKTLDEKIGFLNGGNYQILKICTHY